MLDVVASLLDQAVAREVGSAAAVAIAWPGGQVQHHVGRLARVPTPGLPIESATQFDLASLTKPLSTLTILVQLLGQGRLRLTDRLDAHLPEARATVLGNATVGQLASHASGAQAWLDFYAPTTGEPDRRRAVMRRVLDTPRGTAPGTQAVYSDLGYMALGWLIESVLGKPLDELYRQRVAEPLGLRASFRRLSRAGHPQGVVATEVWPPRCPDGLPLQGQVHDDNAAALDGVAGHAGLFASAGEVLLQAQAWLAAVRGDAGRLALDPQVVRALVTTPGAPATTWRHGWDTPTRAISALSGQTGSTAGELAPADTFGHLGFTGTSVWMSPAHRLIVVLLTNRVHPTRAPTDGIRSLRRALHDSVWSRLVG